MISAGATRFSLLFDLVRVTKAADIRIDASSETFDRQLHLGTLSPADDPRVSIAMGLFSKEGRGDAGPHVVRESSPS